MMRFSRVGHYAVAGVLLTGTINSLLILGVHIPWQAGYVQLLLFKCALVALMVAIALQIGIFWCHGFVRIPGGHNSFLSG